MTHDDVRALVERLDPGATVGTWPDRRIYVLPSAAMTNDGLRELLGAAPDIQVAFGTESPLWADMLDGLAASEPTRARYELDDLEEDGTWKLGRKPEGWGETS